MTAEPNEKPPRPPEPGAPGSEGGGKASPGDPRLADLAEKIRLVGDENRRLFQRLVNDERRFYSLAKTVWRAEEKERRRLASELHDGLGQVLTALKIQLERLSQRATEEGSSGEQSLGASADAAVGLAETALNEARRLSHSLRPQILDDLGLAPALRWFARTYEEWTGFIIDLELTDLEDRRFGHDLETLIFRVVQESMTNALKHSGVKAARVTVAFLSAKHRLILRVRDEGAGCDVAATLGDYESSYGLRGIRDRAEVFGGRVAIRSSPGNGMKIDVELPLPKEKKA